MLSIYRERRRPPQPIEYPEGEGGREICNLRTAEGLRIYKGRTEEMRLRQRKICPMCGLFIREGEGTFEHENLRGAGKQDDRIWVDDQPVNFCLHGHCNHIKGSRRIEFSRQYELKRAT